MNDGDPIESFQICPKCNNVAASQKMLHLHYSVNGILGLSSGTSMRTHQKTGLHNRAALTQLERVLLRYVLSTGISG
jgi:hypothetical protein